MNGLQHTTFQVLTRLTCTPVENNSIHSRHQNINTVFQDSSPKERDTVSLTEVREAFYFILFESFLKKLMCISLESCPCSTVFTCLIKY